ncbi:MAG: helix-turn-helix transcriptional regulator, partial [Clostridia bacterium]
LVQESMVQEGAMRGQRVYVLDAMGAVIASNTEEDFREVFCEAEDAELRARSSLVGRKGFYAYRHSRVLDVQYMIFTPRQVVFGALERVFLIANLLLGLLGGGLLVLAYIMSKRFYQPFRSIADVLTDIRVPDAKPGNELEEARTKLLDVVAVNYSLKNALQDSTPIILESMLLRLIFGCPLTDHFLSATDRYKIVFAPGHYNLFVIRLDLPPDSDEHFYMDYSARFQQILSMHLSDWLFATVFTHPDEYTAVTYCTDCEAIPRIMQCVEEAREEFVRVIPDSSFYIGCGCWTDDALGMQGCYGEAITAIRQRSVNSTRTVLAPKQHPPARQPYLPGDMELELSNRLADGRKEYALQYVGDLLERNRRENISMEAYIMLCNTINGFVIRYVEAHVPGRSGSLLEIAPDTSFYRAVRLADMVRSNLEMAFDLLTHPEEEKPAVIAELLATVETSFNQDINLSVLAERLGYNANYLSRYFKQTQGINFTDYLNRRKLEYAKQLLMDNAQTIKQVAQAAGFNSTALFIKTFERYEGATPGEFKKWRRRPERDTRSVVSRTD